MQARPLHWRQCCRPAVLPMHAAPLSILPLASPDRMPLRLGLLDIRRLGRLGRLGRLARAVASLHDIADAPSRQCICSTAPVSKDGKALYGPIEKALTEPSENGLGLIHSTRMLRLSGRCSRRCIVA